MKYDIPAALQELKPGAQWVLRGFDYSGLEWVDSGQTKPTETELTDKIAELDAAEPMRLLREDAWKTYRQALRDLPASATPKLDSSFKLDLTSVTWPTEPS